MGTKSLPDWAHRPDQIMTPRSGSLDLEFDPLDVRARAIGALGLYFVHSAWYGLDSRPQYWTLATWVRVRVRVS